MTSDGQLHHSNIVTVRITFPSITPTVTVSIGDNSISFYNEGTKSGWIGSVPGLYGSGYKLSFSGFYGYGYTQNEFDSSSSSSFDGLYFEGLARGNVSRIDAEYTEIYAPSAFYLWKPNPVEYVTSTNKTAYTENNMSIDVSSTFRGYSSTNFSYNPTYRFLG